MEIMDMLNYKNFFEKSYDFSRSTEKTMEETAFKSYANIALGSLGVVDLLYCLLNSEIEWFSKEFLYELPTRLNHAEKGALEAKKCVEKSRHFTKSDLLFLDSLFISLGELSDEINVYAKDKYLTKEETAVLKDSLAVISRCVALLAPTLAFYRLEPLEKEQNSKKAFFLIVVCFLEKREKIFYSFNFYDINKKRDIFLRLFNTYMDGYGVSCGVFTV